MRALKTTRKGAEGKRVFQAQTQLRRKVAYAFDEVGPDDNETMGGKGAGLREMVKLGVPVPEGFTITTAVARAFAQQGSVPVRLAFHLRSQMRHLEKTSGRRFGDSENPLLVSVRSGAAVSMPGMLDTVLNLGMNQEIARSLALSSGDARFAWDSFQRFLSMFGEVVMGVAKAQFDKVLNRVLIAAGVDSLDKLEATYLELLCRRYLSLVKRVSGRAVPSDPWEQLDMAVEGVLRSWNSQLAVDYRQHNNIDSNLGTAVNVQRMVMGNRDEQSCSGVAFSRNVVEGGEEIWGDFLVRGQGEDVVNGTRKVPSLSTMAQWNTDVYQQLVAIVRKLENHRRKAVEIEFTVESAVLYILQVRDAKLTPVAAACTAVQFAFSGMWSKEEALASLSREDRVRLSALGLDPEAVQQLPTERRLGQGVAASSGAVQGKVVLTSEAAVAAAKRGEKVVLVRDDTSPADLSGMIAASAIVTFKGGPACHAAVVARNLGKPCIVSLKREKDWTPKEGEEISLDGGSGLVVSGKVPLSAAIQKKEVQVFLGWLKKAEAAKWEAPKLDFTLEKQSVPVERLAGDFYLTEGMAWASRGSELEDECFDLRRQVHTRTAVSIATYFAKAIGGELTHAKSYSESRVPEVLAAQHELAAKYGVVYDDGSRIWAGVISSGLALMSMDEQRRFVELAHIAFTRTHWSSCFGGARWGNIAQALLLYLREELSASDFADHAFDLHHNTGSVFGKSAMIGGDITHLPSLLTKRRQAQSVGALQLLFTGCSQNVRELFEKGVNKLLWQREDPATMRPPTKVNRFANLKASTDFLELCKKGGTALTPMEHKKFNVDTTPDYMIGDIHGDTAKSATFAEYWHKHKGDLKPIKEIIMLSDGSPWPEKSAHVDKANIDILAGHTHKYPQSEIDTFVPLDVSGSMSGYIGHLGVVKKLAKESTQKLDIGGFFEGVPGTAKASFYKELSEEVHSVPIDVAQDQLLALLIGQMQLPPVGKKFPPSTEVFAKFPLSLKESQHE